MPFSYPCPYLASTVTQEGMIKIMVTPNATTSRKRTREEKWKESEKSDAKLHSVDHAKIAVCSNAVWFEGQDCQHLVELLMN